MRIWPLLFALFSLPPTVHGQVPDPGTVGQYPRALPDSGPGAEQDEESAREKILKASDQLDMIQSNSEAMKLSVDGMKSDLAKAQADIAQLQAGNAALRDQVTQLQAALDKAESDRVKARGILLDEVASMIAAKNPGTAKPAPRHHHEEEDPAPETSTPSTEVHSQDGEPGVGAHAVPEPTGSPDSPHVAADAIQRTAPDLAPPPEEAPPPRPQKGYYHVVENGETLTMICAAYRDQGVKVSVAQVRKANGLTSKSTLKVGQKLFIPKPGTGP